MLKFEKIMPAIQEIARIKASTIKQKEDILMEAVQILKKIEIEEYKDVDFSKYNFLVGTPLDKPVKAIQEKSDILEYIAIATDGSEIPVDPDFPILYYMINVGVVVIKYGQGAFFIADSIPEIFYEEKDLYVSVNGSKLLVKGELLQAKMLLYESIYLGKTVEKYYPSSNGVPMLSLIDGTLIQWEVEKRDENYKKIFIDAFESLFNKSKEFDLPIAGYISGSHSRDVLGLIKVMALLNSYSERDIEKFNIIEDTDIFSVILKKGERSVIFKSNAPILKMYKSPIYFFYLNIGEEVVRIEIPEFVANDSDKVSLLHKLILSQAEKGEGYPVVLREAHEQAVIRNGEKWAVSELLKENLIDKGVLFKENYKSVFKKRRSI